VTRTHPGSQAGRSPALSYSVAVNGPDLRHQMRLRGLTAAELARRARARGHRVAEATISHALNGRRIHPAKLRAIAAVLHDVEPLPGVEGLLQTEPRARVDGDGKGLA
jgi:transcriptional regulator with XRE-family HTH domain